MKKIILFLMFLLCANIAHAARQAVESGASVTWDQTKGKINDNFVEVYGDISMIKTGKQNTLPSPCIAGYVLQGYTVTNTAQCVQYISPASLSSTTYTKTEVDNAIAAIPADTKLVESEVDAFVSNNGYQNRVTGTCLGRVVVGINSDGTVICEDDNTGEAGSGEDNVQSDWNTTDTNSDAYIKNKPTLGGGTSQTLSLSVNTLTLSDGGGSVDLAKYLDNTVLTEAQVDAYADNNGYLKTYTETDPLFTVWNKSYNDLTNKPTLFSGNYNDLTNKPTTITAGQASAITANTAKITYPASASTKLAGIAEGATANSTDAILKDRTTHTGTQAISTVTGLQAALDTKMDDITLTAGQVGEVLLPEDPTNGVNTVGFAAPANITSNITFRLPAILGAVGDGFKITGVVDNVAVLAQYHIPAVTVSTSQPSGGSHGDVWYVVQ